MHIELDDEDARVVREVLQQKVIELDTEINRTDRFAFKHELQKIERAVERVIGLLDQSQRQF